MNKTPKTATCARGISAAVVRLFFFYFFILDSASIRTRTSLRSRCRLQVRSYIIVLTHSWPQNYILLYLNIITRRSSKYPNQNGLTRGILKVKMSIKYNNDSNNIANWDRIVNYSLSDFSTHLNFTLINNTIIFIIICIILNQQIV